MRDFAHQIVHLAYDTTNIDEKMSKARFLGRMCSFGVTKPKQNIYTPFLRKPPFWGPMSTARVCLKTALTLEVH